MKKIFALILCVVIVFGSVSASAITTDDCNNYPVVIVPGYAGTPFYRIDESTGEEINVWKPTGDQLIDALKEEILAIGKALGDLTTGEVRSLADTLGQLFLEHLGDIGCNPDGSSKYDLMKYRYSPEETRDSVILAEDDLKCRMEGEICDNLAKYIGHENLFAFLCDFRMGSADCAAELNDYIKQVKELTGKDKVNIYAVSHGGQVAGTYLSLYGTQGDVENAVLTIPALGGAVLAADIMSGDVKFDEELLLRFVQCGFMLEEDLNWLMEAEFLEIVDPLINALIPYVGQVLFTWGSMWDFVPCDRYEELKEKLLDPVENAGIIEKSDRMHYEIMPGYAESFKKVQATGTNISILAGYGVPSIVGTQENSDAIISLQASTGAKVAPFGERFADGYTQEVATGLYQVSPGMEIDASCGYLPYNTWYVDGYFHGMTYKDTYLIDLAEKLLLTDEIKDVTSNEEFPQFHASTNPYEPAFAKFDSSVEGYVSDADSRLIIENKSVKSNMTILSITNSLGLEFDNLAFTKIAPGETVEVEFTGSLPQASAVKGEIYISYLLDNNVTPIGERCLSFTVMNGEKAEFSNDSPFSPQNSKTFAETIFGNIGDGSPLMSGIMDFASILVNIVYSWIETAFSKIGLSI